MLQENILKEASHLNIKQSKVTECLPENYA